MNNYQYGKKKDNQQTKPEEQKTLPEMLKTAFENHDKKASADLSKVLTDGAKVMPGDIIAGEKNECVFHPVELFGEPVKVACKLAAIVSQKIRDGYAFVQVIQTNPGEGFMIFTLKN